MKNNESKYKQVVNFVIDGIAEGKLQKGDWIPSINEFRENYRLSRDTVFAGLSELKSRGIIASTPGVGYYIASARIPSEQNIFLLFNEFNEFKEDLYNSFMEHVGKGVSVDLYLHNYNRRVFEPQIEGSKTSLELPGIVDEVVTLAEIKADDGSAYRAFVTHTVNPYGFPAKDRSGRLDLLEPPHLGALIAKCAGISTSSASATTAQSHESQE